MAGRNFPLEQFLPHFAPTLTRPTAQTHALCPTSLLCLASLLGRADARFTFLVPVTSKRYGCLSPSRHLIHLCGRPSVRPSRGSALNHRNSVATQKPQPTALALSRSLVSMVIYVSCFLEDWRTNQSPNVLGYRHALTTSRHTPGTGASRWVGAHLDLARWPIWVKNLHWLVSSRRWGHGRANGE
jgi:hypothetical protein